MKELKLSLEDMQVIKEKLEESKLQNIIHVENKEMQQAESMQGDKKVEPLYVEINEK